MDALATNGFSELMKMLMGGQTAPAPGTMPAPANPNVMAGPDPLTQAAATMTQAGAQPPAPVAGKPPTALPDRNGQPMLPAMGSGEMGGYYNDTPDPTQPLTAAGVATPTQQLGQAAGSMFSGLQDVVAPQTEAPRAPSPISPQSPNGRADMTALMQMITQAGQRPEPNKRGALAAMLMGGR